MKKILVIIILVVLLIFGVYFFKYSSKNLENGNIANMGLVCEYNGTIYYSKYEKGIFSLDKGKEVKLTDEAAYSLNVVNDKIYYITVSDFNNIVIKSIDINGENLKKRKTIYTSISKIYVDDQFIYYSTNETGKGIAKVDLNGENEEVLVSESVQDFEVKDNNIYYVDYNNQIYKLDIYGKDKGLLSDMAVARKIQINNSWIYYYDQNENALFRLKIDGKRNELVSTLIHNETYNIFGKYVYYFDKENLKIARMQIGRSNKCQDIVNLNVSKTKINIAKDELYYLDKSKSESQDYQINKIKIDGSKTENIEY